MEGLPLRDSAECALCNRESVGPVRVGRLWLQVNEQCDPAPNRVRICSEVPGVQYRWRAGDGVGSLYDDRAHEPVDRLLSNLTVNVWEMFADCMQELVGATLRTSPA